MFGIKWLGSQKTPDEKAAATIARIEARAKVDAVRSAQPQKPKRKHSIAKAIIRVTDVGFVTALAVACLVAYCLDMIFFFQQAKVLWLSLLMCALGFIFRTIAICGGVMLEWAEEDEASDKVGELDFKKQPIRSGLRWAGKTFSFSTARMTLRVMTWACWIVCIYATVSFFSSGHEMRKFSAESATALESVQVVNAESVIADLRTQNAALDKDKQDIRADRDKLIAGARQSMTEVQTDNVKENDDLSLYERNIARYNTEADGKIGAKDALIAENNEKIREIQTGKGEAHIEAQAKKTEVDPALAVYSFLATITGMSTDGWTIGSAILFAFVFELIVDTGLKNYFRLKKGFIARLRRIEMKQISEDAAWELERFNTVAAANLANARAQADAAQSKALQDRELAELTMLTQREMARTEAAKLGVPWLDPVVTLNAKQRLAEAELDRELAKIEQQAREEKEAAELLRNPPPKPPEPVVTSPPASAPPASNDDEDEEERERRIRKQQESRRFNQDQDDINAKLKVRTADWRNRFAAGA